MNKEWSELSKLIKAQIKEKITYQDGIESLFRLRNQLMNVINSFKSELSSAEFNAMPFANCNGHHNKTIAYSLWHIFRIEDIVAHSLIKGNEQVFFSKQYYQSIGSSIITTGNELVKQQIADFSKELDLNKLYSYIADVKKSSEEIIMGLSYEDLKTKFTDKKREQLRSLNVVSNKESAYWLIDYWCEKDIRGLIGMPFSRHWIMHIEACLRIKNKLQGNGKG